MNWINGRPDDWVKDIDCDCPFFSDSTGDPINCSQRPNDYESGASAMLSALLVYLDEPCDKHIAKGTIGELYYPEHRYLCPQCMKELRGEK